MGESPDVFARRMATPDGQLRGARRARRDGGFTDEERAAAASLLPTWHPERPVLHTVYELRHPVPGAWRPELRDQLPPGTHPDTFYVGKSRTDVNRLANHVYDATSAPFANHRLNIIRRLLRAGLAPHFVEIERYPTEEAAFEAERARTRLYPPGFLTNAREGGLTGWAPSPETRAKTSARLKGKPLPQHVREAQRAAATGRPKTLQEIELIRAAMKDRQFTDEHRARLREHHWSRDPERARAIAETQRARFAGRNTKFTDQVRDRAFELYRAGATNEAVAQAVGMSVGQVTGHLRAAVRAGELRERPEASFQDKDLQRERLERAAAMHTVGATRQEVMTTLGLSATSSYYNVMRRAATAGLIDRLGPTRGETTRAGTLARPGEDTEAPDMNPDTTRCSLTAAGPRFEGVLRDEAFRRYRAGESYAAIASAIGMNRSHVAEQLAAAVRAGLLPARDRRDRTDAALQQKRLERAARMHRDGATIEEIRAALGLSAASSVYSLLDRAAKGGMIAPLARTKGERAVKAVEAGRGDPERVAHARLVARTLELRDARHSITDIVILVGKDRRWVTSTLRENGRSSDDRLTAADNARILELNGQGVSQGELARRYGVSRPRIGQIIAAAKAARPA